MDVGIIEKIILITDKISGEVIAAFVGLIGGHLLHGVKIKKEQKIQFQNNIGNEIAESLKVIKDICIKASEYERYGFEESLKQGEVVKAFDLGIYPSVMGSMSELIDYFSEILEVRKKYEYYLNRRCAIHLLYIEQYLNELMTYILSINMGEHMPDMGCIFLKDIQDWYISLEKEIAKDINKHRVKIHVHKGFLWNLLKKHIRWKLYNKSILVLVQKEGKLSSKDEEIKTMIEGLLDIIKEESGQDL